MADKTKHEYELDMRSPIDSDDAVRFVGGNQGSYRVTLNDLAAYIAETYANSNLGGANRSIKSIIDNLTDRVNGIESLVNGDAGGDVTELWTGKAGVPNEHIILSDDMTNYDYFDVYYHLHGNSGVRRFAYPQFVAANGPYIKGVNVTDDVSGSGMWVCIGEIRLIAQSSNDLLISEAVRWQWSGYAGADSIQSIPTTSDYGAGHIYKINGIKNRDLTNIFAQLAALDVRVRALEGN